MITTKITKLGAIPTLLYFILILVSCSEIRLISDYDEVTDKKVSLLQEKFTKFFVNLEENLGNEKSAYDSNKVFYQDIEVDLRTLQLRADAFEKNTIMQQNIEQINSMKQNLQALHKAGFNKLSQVRLLESAFNRSFEAILKYQLALKRGKK